MKFRVLSLVFLALLLSSCGLAPKDEALRKKIAQMLVVGFDGASAEEIESESRGAKYYVQELGVGGVILFYTNVQDPSKHKNIVSPEQVFELTSYLQALSPDTLFIAIDQEGGAVIRLDPRSGFPATVSAQYLGTQGLDSTAFHARKTAQLLSDYGFNLNFAPCVDVNVNPDCPIIGKKERSFSSDPAVVAECAKIWIEEHGKLGVRSTIKHFPGHGSALGDTHLGVADVTKTWQDCELAPYRELISDGTADMVMVAHVFNDRLDPKYPASLSRKTITGLLREELGFQGLVISDDLMMKAIVDDYSFPKALELAINAGCDILILSNNLPHSKKLSPLDAVDIIERLVRRGKISPERIDESYARIMRYKGQS